MKKCSFCGNKNFKDVTTQYIYKHDQKFLIVNDVPCEQCEFCGEKYFEAKTLKVIEREFHEVHVNGKKTASKLHIPVEPFLELQRT